MLRMSPARHSPRSHRGLEIASQVGPEEGALLRAPSPGASPFRDILRQHSVHSREGRVLTLLADFSSKVTRPCSGRVSETISKVERTHFLPQDDRTFLLVVRERNAGFMTNLETILNSAVSDDEPMERSVVQRCYQRWSECNAQNVLIDELLARYPKERNSPAINRPSPKRSGSPSTVFRSVSRSRPTAMPTCFAEIQRPSRSMTPRSRINREMVSQRSPPHSVILERNTLCARPVVTADDAKEAQAMFIRLFGEEQGRAQFLAWLSELPIEQLRTLQAQLQVSRN